MTLFIIIIGLTLFRNAAGLALEPLSPKYWPMNFPAKDHCSKCGLCETSFVKEVKSACPFLEKGMSEIESLEERFHQRSRHPNEEEESRFGVLYEPIQLSTGVELPAFSLENNATVQWTGVVTNLAITLLETNMVDAVVCVSSEVSSIAPKPILAKTVEEILHSRGVKPSLSPSLNVLDKIRNDPSIKRLLFCGVGCAVQAFRKVQDQLGLEEVFVIGTNCADNSPTPEAARNFIENGLGVPIMDSNGYGKHVIGYEFMQDFRVHVKVKDHSSGDMSYIKIPYFSLPGSIAKESIAPSCLTCFDYTNALADISVGYMGGQLSPLGMMKSAQTITIRNAKGKLALETAVRQGRILLHGPAGGKGNYQEFAVSTVEADGIVAGMIGKEPMKTGMPLKIGNIVASIVTFLAPKGLKFARYSIDYHILRNYLYLIDTWGESRANGMLPRSAKSVVDDYIKNFPSFKCLKEAVSSK